MERRGWVISSRVEEVTSPPGAVFQFTFVLPPLAERLCQMLAFRPPFVAAATSAAPPKDWDGYGLVGAPLEPKVGETRVCALAEWAWPGRYNTVS